MNCQFKTDFSQKPSVIIFSNVSTYEWGKVIKVIFGGKQLRKNGRNYTF